MTDTLEGIAAEPTAYQQAWTEFMRLQPHDIVGFAQVGNLIMALAEELADERAIVRDQGAGHALLWEKIAEIRFDLLAHARRINQVHEQSTGTAGAQQPTIRLRINHSHTLKEGWRLSETTVEWIGPGKPDEAAIQDALLTAQHLGQREAALRNAPPADEEDAS